jgi:hypothetical protein
MPRSQPPNGRFSEVFDVLIGRQESLLHHILRQFEIGQHAHGGAVGVVLVAAHEFGESLAVAVQNVGYQNSVALFAHDCLHICARNARELTIFFRVVEDCVEILRFTSMRTVR